MSMPLFVIASFFRTPLDSANERLKGELINERLQKPVASFPVAWTSRNSTYLRTMH